VSIVPRSGHSTKDDLQVASSERSHRLELQDAVCAKRHTVVLAGEVDIASVAILDTVLTNVCESGPEAVVLDLCRVSFMDSAGIHAIRRAEQLCRELDGCWFALIPGGNPRVLRVLELTGVLDHFSSGAKASTPGLNRRGATLSGAVPDRRAARDAPPRREPYLSLAAPQRVGPSSLTSTSEA
jgi:anti-anti-sigma factor